MNIVLISTYELGHQPFGLASPAAWLRVRGLTVSCFDLSRETFREEPVRDADLVAFYVPMHTATRLAIELIETVRRIAPAAHLCFYGLYAPVNEGYLRALGVGTILGGEFEGELVKLVMRLTAAEEEGARSAISNSESDVERGGGVARISTSISPTISLDRLEFIVPDRSGLPGLPRYAHVVLPDGGHLVAGYTEASRGCKHLCRHCPIVPVYNGAFRVVPRDVILEDIRRQVSSGAQHITFGDPDFFNGRAHALGIVEALHREFPRISYDATIKIEHLLRHREHLTTLRNTGCLFVTTAVESVDDAVLDRLAKGHTRADFLQVAEHFRELDMVLQPTFVPFHPWTTLESYRDLLSVIAAEDLEEHIAPIQLGIRLLIPAGSRLLELEEVRNAVGTFDAAALFYPWKHSDPRLDTLAEQVQDLAVAADKAKWSRSEAFARIWEATAESAPASAKMKTSEPRHRAIPHFTEPWYCCAEPTREQFVSIGLVSIGATGVVPAAADARTESQHELRAANRVDGFS